MTKVSILIAARNEAHTILDCLQSVEALSYPKENLQILVGNDASEDDTEQLVQNFITEKPYFQLINVINRENSINATLKGKANVLAQLAQHATGEYLFFTDADIEVPKDWIQNMLLHFKKNVGIVTGITTIKTPIFPKNTSDFLAFMQALEWLYYLSITRLFSLFNVPITAMGNNMAVSRMAYSAVGGYENILFSITEDYALFRAILDKHFRFVQLFDRRVLTISKPIATYYELLVQRKRWMYGAMSLPWGLRIGVFFNGLLLPSLVLLSLFFWPIASLLMMISYLFLTAWIVGILNWLQYTRLFIALPFFWFYHLFTNFAMLIFYYGKKQIVWKGRKY